MRITNYMRGFVYSDNVYYKVMVFLKRNAIIVTIMLCIKQGIYILKSS